MEADAMREFQVGDFVRFKSIRFTPINVDYWIYGVLVAERHKSDSLHWRGRVLGPKAYFDEVGHELGYSYSEKDIELVPLDEIPDEICVELAKWRLAQ
jgi:hypothetical protein